MEVNANYVESISSCAIKELKKMLFRYAENYKGISKDEIEKFITHFKQVEEVLTESLTDAIAYKLCKGEKVFGSVDLSKNYEKENVYKLALEGYPKIANSKLLADFSKNHDVRISGNLQSMAVKKVVLNKVKTITQIDNPTVKQNEEIERNM